MPTPPVETEGFATPTEIGARTGIFEGDREEGRKREVDAEEDVEARNAWAEEATANDGPLRRVASVATLAEDRMAVEPQQEAEEEEPQPALLLERERRVY